MTARTVPPGLAPIIELLELEQPRVVSVAQMTCWARETGIDWAPDLVVRRLRERRWLLPLATKGVWEFAPAARAGAFSSGDPLIELRAVMARDPKAPYMVAAESAAYLLGYASRRPERECVSAPRSLRPPKALAAFHVVRWEPSTQPVVREGLTVWSPATLLAFMATRPSGYHDWPNAGEWLMQAAAAIGVDDLSGELEGRTAGAWARAAYLLQVGGQAERAAMLIAQAPQGKGPHYLGDRSFPGRYSGEYDVIDSTGLEVEGS